MGAKANKHKSCARVKGQLSICISTSYTVRIRNLVSRGQIILEIEVKTENLDIENKDLTVAKL